jgi:flagellar biosynthesis/type III secretory pathway M-ring protein FliF/YscJ
MDWVNVIAPSVTGVALTVLAAWVRGVLSEIRALRTEFTQMVARQEVMEEWQRDERETLRRLREADIEERASLRQRLDALEQRVAELAVIVRANAT